MFSILDSIMIAFAKNDDYLTGIFAHADKHKDEKLEVPTRLHGDKIEWHPELLKGMGDGNREVQFAGELVHLALGHPDRMKQMAGGVEGLWTLAEIAMQLSTYHMLEHDSRPVPPEVFIRPEKFKDKNGQPFPLHESAELYFQLLVDLFNSKDMPMPGMGQGQGQDQQDQQGQGQQSQQGQGQGEGEEQEGEGQSQGEGEGEDKKDGKGGQGQEDPVDEALKSMGIDMPKRQQQDMSKWGSVPKTSQEMAKVLLKEGLQRFRGTLPEGWRRILKELETEEKEDYKRIIEKMMGSKFAIRRFRKTMKRPSRRFGVGWPGKKKLHRGALVQAFDSSGSVRDHDMAVMVSQGKHLAKRYGAPYLAIVCDAKIQTIKMIRKVVDLDEIEVLGGGGTSSLPVFQYLEDNRIRTDLLVYFTDLEIDFPKEQPKVVRSTAWVVINNPTQDHAPFGDVINVEVKS